MHVARAIHYLGLALGLIFVTSATAQDRLELAAFFGMTNYQGDLAEDHVELEETKVAVGGILRYHISPRWAIRAHYFSGTITGDDENSIKLAWRRWKVDIDVKEWVIGPEFYILPVNRFGIGGRFEGGISPYVSVGMGLTHADAVLTVPPEDQDRFPEPGDRDNFFVTPIILGVRFDFSEYSAFMLEVGWRNIFSDYLDGVSMNGGYEKNDWYSFAGASFSIFFGKPANAR